MGKYRISAKAWRMASDVLLWYPDTKREYDDAIQEAMSRDPDKSGSAKQLHPDPTAAAAIRLNSSRRAAQLAREIEAVEEAMSELRDEEKAVIIRRFWSVTRKGRRKPVPYDYIFDTGYEIAQMKRIVGKTIRRVALSLGAV